jgi:hypothetical protein
MRDVCEFFSTVLNSGCIISELLRAGNFGTKIKSECTQNRSQNRSHVGDVLLSNFLGLIIHC